MRRSHLALLLFLQACLSVRPAVLPSGTPASLTVSPRAERIYRDAIVIDVHNDMPSKMIDEGYNADIRHAPGFEPTQGETDLPRLVESGITGQYMSAWVDATYALKTPDESWKRVQIYLDTIHAWVRRNTSRLTFATTAREVRDAKTQGKVAILIGVEGGHAIEGSIDNLRELHRRDVRYMTLTWNNGNAWAGSSAGINGTRKGGLTAHGRDIVREMNRLGMFVDVSHVSDSTFFDVIATTSDPVIASHSSARALNSHWRNMSDDQLRAVARNGGVVNVNFYSVFVDPEFLEARVAIDRQVRVERELALQRQGVDSAAVLAAATRKTDSLTRALPKPKLSVLIDHIVHIAGVAGIDHVGLGSDFDGVGGLLPEGIDDVTKLPLIAQALLDRGYSEQEVKKVLGGNMMRVMERVLDRK